MKTRFSLSLAAITVGLALSTSNLFAQETTATVEIKKAPKLSYGAAEVLKLSQAGVAEDTIVSYVENSGRSYGMSADEVVYLHEQGVSGKVVAVMLKQRPAAPQPVSDSALNNQTSTWQTQAAQPVQASAPTYVEQPASTVYVIPNSPRTVYYGSSYYYPSYGYYGGYYSYPRYYSYCGPRYSYYPRSYCGPSISLSFGFRGSHVGFRGGGFRCR